MADALLEHAQGRALLADAGYDSGRFVMAVLERGMEPVIRSNPSRTHELYDLNEETYAERYRIEVFFHHLKRFRAIATRYEKTAQNYLALAHLACAFLWLRELT